MGGNLSVPNASHMDFHTITQVVNHFKVSYLENATKLGEPVHLVASFLDDCNVEGESFRRGQQISIKRNSQKHIVDKLDRQIEPELIEILNHEQSTNTRSEDTGDEFSISSETRVKE